MKKSYIATFKAQIVLELLKERKTLNQLADGYGIAPTVLREILYRKEVYMNRIKSLIVGHPIVTFFGLAFAFSWWPSLIEPHGIFPLGPFIAALFMVAMIDRWNGVKVFLGRIVQWRVGMRWYALVLGLPVLLNALAVGLNMLLGAQPTPERMPPLSNLAPFFFSVLIFIGLGEEPAWRGFGLPRLSAGRSALVGSLLLGILHAVWHLPLFGLEYDLQNGVPWFIGLMGYSVIMTWMYNHTNGSLLLPILFHTSVNTTAKYLFNPIFKGADLIALWWIWGALWVGVAVALVLVVGPSLMAERSRMVSTPTYT